MNKLLLSMARQIHRRLVAHSRTDPFLAILEEVREAQSRLNTAWQRLQTARQRGWHEAARLVRQDLFARAGELNEKLAHAIAQEAVSPPPHPSLLFIIEELKQLHDEFEDVQLCMNQHGQRRVKAVTEPITLEDVELGRFSIELDLHRLSTRCTSACFDCKALDPNYASSNSDVTHPHVSGDALCAGDATLPISNAVSQGRICDAFCLVRSVLTTYNDASPYVALENWHGVSCSDCGCSVDSDYFSHCEQCGNGYCDGCMSTCEICDQNVCNGCLEKVALSDRYCCPNCRHTCSQCSRTVSTDDFNDQTQICTACEEEKENHEHDNTDNNTNHAQQPLSPAEQSSPDDDITPPDRAHADLQPAGVAQAAVLPPRRRHRNRRVRHQQRR